MENLKEALIIIADYIEIIGVLVLVYGFAKFFVKFIKFEFVKYPFKSPLKIIQAVRCDLGIFILLSLDFLIASDIIFSITDLSWNQLMRLAVLIGIRTVIGFFLGKEIEEIEHDGKKY